MKETRLFISQNIKLTDAQASDPKVTTGIHNCHSSWSSISADAENVYGFSNAKFAYLPGYTKENLNCDTHSRCCLWVTLYSTIKAGHESIMVRKHVWLV